MEYWHLPKEGMRRICSWHFESIELLSDVVIKKCSWPLIEDFTGVGLGNGKCLSCVLFLLDFLLLLRVCIHLFKKNGFLKYIVFCFITPKYFWRNYFKCNLQEMRNCVVCTVSSVEHYRSSVNIWQTVKIMIFKKIYICRYYLYRCSPVVLSKMI